MEKDKEKPVKRYCGKTAFSGKNYFSLKAKKVSNEEMDEIIKDPKGTRKGKGK